ncbi:TlpA disulfide reductase family protein [Mucilaginibacter sp. CSA2-8R]|uniref:TlpA family protein disulfide reductase n=1 Tax=Mucilaginibacter sp. CSA2-8R TaxID=3141542 RepID=UPI00315D7024
MTPKYRSHIVTLKNVLNVVYVGVILLLLFNPTSKAILIRALMKIGFFQPDVTVSAKLFSNERLPDATFTDATGKTCRLPDLRGKVIFINFRATWCPPCIAEMPGISQLYNQFQNNQNVVFITVDVDRQLTKSSIFLKQHKWLLPLYQVNSILPKALSGGSIPLTIIFDRQGKLVYRHEGVADYTSKGMIEFIQTLSR